MQGSPESVSGRESTYELREMIGSGGRSVVYRAVDTQSGQAVAVKCLLSGRDLQQRWRDEVQAMVGLAGCRHVVRYLDQAQVGNNFYIVMEYAPHGALSALIPRDPAGGGTTGMPEGQAARYIYQIVDGVAELHSRGRIHRDLKAANVLVFDKDEVKLADLGLATDAVPPQPADSEQQSQQQQQQQPQEQQQQQQQQQARPSGTSSRKNDTLVLGSVYWLAPEVAAGAAHDARSDIWALGCVALELLAGHPPLHDRAPANALFTLAEGSDPVVVPDTLSLGAQDFLRVCLQRDPAARPQASALLRHNWLLDLRVGVRLSALAGAQRRAEPESGDDTAAAASANNSAAGGSTRTTGDGSSSHSRAVAVSQETSASAALELGSSNSAAGPGPVAATAAASWGGSLPVPTDDIGQWVEAHLFSKSAQQSERWLQEGNLQKVVSVLSSVTAGESFRIIRSLAFAAQRSRGGTTCFFDCLGQTRLWSYTDLSVLCTLDDLASLFCACCERQSVAVGQFAPSHPQAIRMLLRSENKGITGACVDALLQRLTRGGDSGTAAAGDAQRAQVQQRMVADKGLVALRGVVEQQCEASFQGGTEPPLGWAGIDRVVEILYRTDPTPAARRCVYGAPVPASSAAAAVSVNEALSTTSMSGASVGRSPRAEDQASAAAGEDGDGGAAAASASGAAADDGEGAGGARTLVLPEEAASAEEVERYGTTQAPRRGWCLALLEASRHGCPYALRLTLKLVKLYLDTEEPFLAKVVTSVVGTLLMVAAAPTLGNAPLQAEALHAVVALRKAHPRVSAFLRDGRGATPLLGYALDAVRATAEALAAGVPPPEVEEDGAADAAEASEVLRALLLLCEDDRLAASCGSCPVFAQALAGLIIVVVTKSAEAGDNTEEAAALAALTDPALRLLDRLQPVLGAVAAALPPPLHARLVAALESLVPTVDEGDEEEEEEEEEQGQEQQPPAVSSAGENTAAEEEEADLHVASAVIARRTLRRGLRTSGTFGTKPDAI